MMVRKTDGAVGYDVYFRAIVHHTRKDPLNENLRQTLYDFGSHVDPSIKPYVQEYDFDDGRGPQKVVRLDPGRWLHCAIGVVLEIEFPYYGDLRPRSGLASKGVTMVNTPGTIDPDYRGEACAILTNISPEPYFLERDERIGQMLILRANVPTFDVVDDYSELTQTIRATGGFGSTGRMG